MTKKSMNMDPVAGADLDQLIAGADPVTTTQPTPEESAHPVDTAPWAMVPESGKISTPLYISPQIKAMMDFLREETGVPSQVLMRKILEPAIRAKAEQLWNTSRSE